MNSQRPFLIFSVYLSSKDDKINIYNHEAVMKMLKKRQIPYVELYGRYMWEQEESILVDGFEHRELVEDIVKAFGQESYLESHGDGSTFLIFTDDVFKGCRKYIGQFIAVSEEQAKASRSYSYNPNIGQYFITQLDFKVDPTKEVL